MNTRSPQFILRNLALGGLLLITPATSGADYQGAGSVLRKVEEQTAKKKGPAEKPNETSQLRKELADFSKKVAALPAADAAKAWLDLVDRHYAVSRRMGRNPDPHAVPVSSAVLMAALPPPGAWGELSKAIAARPPAKGPGEIRQIGLRLLAATLVGDTAARSREIGVLQEKAGNADPQSAYFYRNLLEQISEAMLSSLDDPEAVLKSLDRRLASGSGRGPQQLSIPDLVSLVGTQKAEVFLRRALQLDIELDIQGQNETSRLAKKLALELIDRLKKPQWNLVDSLDAIALYEALDKRFGQAKAKTPAAPVPGLPDLPDLSSLNDSDLDQARLQAQNFYLLGLISKERTKDAVAVAKKLGKQTQSYMRRESLKALERAGYLRAMDDFFFELLSQDPTLSYWDDYVELAAKAGQTERMLKLARATAARDDLPRARKVALHRTLYRAFLAAGQTEEGVQEIRRLIELDEKASESNADESAGQLGLTLARIGTLLKRADWTDEGIRMASKSISDSAEEKGISWQADIVVASLADALLELGRGPEAEALLTDALVKTLRTSSQEGGYPGSESSPAQETLVALAGLYHAANRHADVIGLLDQAPYWGANDLAEINDNNFGGVMVGFSHSNARSSPYYLAASALAGAGRKAEARKLIDALLDREPGSDRGYELLIESAGAESALVRLDELFARDPFEERPLIWKAELLRRANKLEEAEKIARQAIPIDPSDGEQGPGDRLRAYAVLAEIRAARGDAKEADFFRGAVRAIRLAENADKYYEAGLLKTAIQMYEDSLKQFADAYCIQSRLAVQLAELGRHEEAEAHYRRAYELMPDSFGRVESHCFGCERAFEGQRAQSMAEKIFTELAVKTPDKPQVHYLLGYLRKEQERPADAIGHFQTAVKLDPDYLNAWKELDSMADHFRVPAKERDRIAFNILRLDPLQRHVSVNFGKVSDLAGLWNAIETSRKSKPPTVTTLYPLPASRAALEKIPDDPARQQRAMYRSIVEESRELSPARAVSQAPFIRIAEQIFTGSSIEE